MAVESSARMPSGRPKRSCAPVSFAVSKDLVSQGSSDEEEIYLEESDGEDEVYFDTRAEKAAFERKTKREAKLAEIAEAAALKEKVKNFKFPFMSLPAEIRNMIYKYALVEEAQDLSLAVSSEYAINLDNMRLVRGTVEWRFNGFTSHYKTMTVKLKDSHTKLTPALLAVNRQINDEACPVLYGQTIHCETPLVLKVFLYTIGQKRRQLLQKLVLRSWDRFIKGEWSHDLREGLALLNTITNLQSILFAKRRGLKDSLDRLEYLAQDLHKELRLWVQLTDASRGEGACKNLVRISDDVFGTAKEQKENQEQIEERRKVFMKGLWDEN